MKNYSEYIKQLNEGLWDEMPSDEELKIKYPHLETPLQRAREWQKEYNRTEKEKEMTSLSKEKLGLDLKKEREEILFKLNPMLINAQKKDPSFLDKLFSLMGEYPHLAEDQSIRRNPVDKFGNPVKVIGSSDDPAIRNKQTGDPF